MQRNFLTCLICTFVVSFELAGCSTYWESRKAHNLIREGKTEGVISLQGLAEKKPETFRYDYLKQRDETTQKLLKEAQNARVRDDLEVATKIYNDILTYDSQSAEALRGLLLLEQRKKEKSAVISAKEAISQNKTDYANEILESITRTNPTNIEAKILKSSIKPNQPSLLYEPQLSATLRKPVSLTFVDVDIRSLFDFLSQTSGVNFIFDREVKPDLRTTIFAKDTTIEDALKLILRTNQLKMKVLNDKTLLIYTDTEDKQRQYDDLVVRKFYLKNIEPKKMQEMIKSLITPKYIYIDDQLKLLIVRDNIDVMNVVEKLVDAYDLVEPEVLLEVEVLEVSSDDMLNLGIKYPDQIKLGLNNNVAGLTLNQLKNLSSNNYPVFFPDPLAILNLKQTNGKTNTLANPRIRVINQQKAKFLIGDKVPVITTTVNQTSSASTESINYLDVGLSLTVEPTIRIDDEVSIVINMEVSNIVKEIKSTTGLLAYQIGTRNVSTVLRLHNGETQVLAGLIKKDQTGSASHVPGLGKLPILGKLFSDETKHKSNSEIVLLITPHIIRNMNPPELNNNIFSSGTNNSVSNSPLRLTSSASYRLTNSTSVSGNLDDSISRISTVNNTNSDINLSSINSGHNNGGRVQSIQSADSISPSQLATPLFRRAP